MCRVGGVGGEGRGREPAECSSEVLPPFPISLPLSFTRFLSPPATLSDYVRSAFLTVWQSPLNSLTVSLTSQPLFQSWAVFLPPYHLSTLPQCPSPSLHRWKMSSWCFGRSPGWCWLYYQGSSLSPWKPSIVTMTSVLLLRPGPAGMRVCINTLLPLETILQGLPPFTFPGHKSPCRA